jgi:hypothetical protein
MRRKTTGNTRRRGAGRNLLWLIVVLAAIFLVVPQIFSLLAFVVGLVVALGIIVAISREFKQVEKQSGAFKANVLHNNLSKTTAAAERAKAEDGDIDLELNDIGMLVYKGTIEPSVYRLEDVPITASHIRPFVVISPYHKDEFFSSIRFNLIDEQGKLRYTAKVKKVLSERQNFLTPTTWLPLAAQDNMGKSWWLEVNVDAQQLAMHQFRWLPVGGETRAQFTGDGEIDELLLNAELLAPDDPISLDALLAGQQMTETDQH